MSTKRLLTLTLLGAAMALVVGCGPDPTQPIQASAAPAPQDAQFVPEAEAGIRIAPGDPATLLADAGKFSFQVRQDPFALRPAEVAFDRSEFAARLVDTVGFYPQIAEEAEPPVETFEVEPQPTRRLAGIILGESITALIDMGNGQLILIRPGQAIEGTEWVVQSIDEEKAILRRVGSTKRPKYVVVRLQPDDGSTVTNTGGGQGQGGRQQGGRAGNAGGGQGREPD
jgi:hypothetical protein